MSVCDKTVNREMFCLDDGISWVAGVRRERSCMWMESICL